MSTKKSTLKHPQITVNALDGTCSFIIDWPNLSNYSVADVTKFSDNLYLTCISLTGGNTLALSHLIQAIGYTGGLKNEEVFAKGVINMITNFLVRSGYNYGKADAELAQTQSGLDEEPLVGSEDVLDDKS